MNDFGLVADGSRGPGEVGCAEAGLFHHWSDAIINVLGFLGFLVCTVAQSTNNPWES